MAERVATQKGDASRAEYARAKAAALEPRLAVLHVSIAGGRAADVRVTVDGSPVDAFLVEGGTLAFAPGKYRLEASAPGKTTWRTDVELTTGRVVAKDIRLEDAPLRASTPPVLVTPPTTEASSSSQRTIAWIVGGMGVAAAAVGTVAGIAAVSEKAALDDLCSRGGGSLPDRCGGGTLSPAEHQDARNARDAASTTATVSTVAFVASGVLLVAGLVLYLTAPAFSTSSTSTATRANVARTALEWRW